MISLVVPCFNEAGRFDLDYWKALLQIDGIRWVFVDDGSTDETFKLLNRVGSPPQVAVLRRALNGGKSEAVRMGMLKELQETFALDLAGVGFIDADGAFEADDIASIVSRHLELARNGTVDATWSARVALAGRHIHRRAVRHYVGRLASTLLSAGGNESPYDTQSGFKVFANQPELGRVLETPFQTRWLFEWEMMIRWNEMFGQAMRIWEEPLSSWHEVSGSKAFTGREAMRIAKELLVIKELQSPRKQDVRKRRDHSGERV